MLRVLGNHSRPPYLGDRCGVQIIISNYSIFIVKVNRKSNIHNGLANFLRAIIGLLNLRFACSLIDPCLSVAPVPQTAATILAVEGVDSI